MSKEYCFRYTKYTNNKKQQISCTNSGRIMCCVFSSKKNKCIKKQAKWLFSNIPSVVDAFLNILP